MFFLNRFLDIQLDIVGFLAILGEGSVERNAQAASLSWYHKLPRLLPAPQALMKHERPGRLPTEAGTVVGAYSGNIRHELNFFIRLVHPEPLEPFEVELVCVKRKRNIPTALAFKILSSANTELKAAPGDQNGRDPENGNADSKRPSFSTKGMNKYAVKALAGENPTGAASYGVSNNNWLFTLAAIGSAMSIALVALSVVYDDGMSLLATILLSLVSFLVGLGSEWELDIPPVNVNRPENQLPTSDVVIYYPNGAMRVVRCSEEISRLYFTVERCNYSWADTPYRIMSLISTVMLMFGVIFLANATEKLQLAYAAAYILLNAMYWGTSALNPVKHYWDCAYESHPINIAPLNHDKEVDKIQRSTTWSVRIHGPPSKIFQPRKELKLETTGKVAKLTFSRALWMTIALTGTSQWVNHSSHIGPMTEAWTKWHSKAEENAISPTHREGEKAWMTWYDKAPGPRGETPPPIKIPDWDWAKELSEVLQDARKEEGTSFRVAAIAIKAARRLRNGGNQSSAQRIESAAIAAIQRMASSGDMNTAGVTTATDPVTEPSHTVGVESDSDVHPVVRFATNS